MSGENTILLALLVPLIGAILIALLGARPNLRETVTLLSAGGLLLLVISLFSHVLNGERPTLHLLEILPGLTLAFSVEPLGMIFAGIATLLWPINSLYSIGYMRCNQEKKQTRFYVCFALSLFSVIGIAFADNLLTLFIFYESLTLVTYPLVTHKESDDAVRAGRLYLGMLFGTSIGLLLLAIIWTWQATGTLTFTPGGILTGKVTGSALGLLLFLFVFGIGKAAMMPVHRWLPAAMVAPTPVSALLHAVAVVKAGVFCVVKVIVYIFGLDLLASEPSTNWLLYMAGFTIIVASVIALRSDNLKRLLAYSTVSQLSYVILAVAILSPLSLVGSIMHIVAHAFGKITLFFAAGAIYTATHKTEVSQLNGIGRRMPLTMGAFSIGALSMIGLPPAAGFLSKWYMLLGAIDMQAFFAIVIIIVSTLLNAAYYIPIIYAAFFKPEAVGTPAGNGEAPMSMVVALMATAGLTLLLFLFADAPVALAWQMTKLLP